MDAVPGTAKSAVVTVDSVVRGEDSLRIRRLAARFVGGGYVVYSVVCVPEIRADAVIVAPWWTPLAVVLCFWPGWMLLGASFTTFRGRLASLLPL